MNIKPIETVYNGYRFRSRLEARWAVFFDAAGIKYQYEPEGYEVNRGGEVIRYLPDFYLPDQNVHVEVKPSLSKLMEDSEKLAWMIDFGGPMADGLVVLGQIPTFHDEWIADYAPAFMYLHWDSGICWEWATFVGQKKCNLLIHPFESDGCSTAPDLLDFGLMSDRCKAELEDLYLHFTSWPMIYSDAIFTLALPDGIPLEKYRKARQARFEYGETPS